MFSYAGDGLAHLLAGFVLVAIFSGLFQKGRRLEPLFWFGFILSSSALFFLPNKIVFLGRLGNWFYQFCHYPVSDWDILLLGFSWHRFFFTHSCFLALIVFGAVHRNPNLAGFSQGFTIGLSSHLIWDGVSCSSLTPVVFFPSLFAISGVWAKTWLIGNGIIAFRMAGNFRK